MTKTTFATEDRPEAVDVSKCRFNMGRVQFMNEEHDPDEGSLKHPITILARTDGVVDHWWWGRIVHDLEGIEFHKESIVVDYCHRDDMIMGYVNEFSIENGFHASGALVRRPGSMAEEVIVNAENDVPYEASVFWDPDHGMVIEEVGQGASVQVNGTTFEGPGVVIRKCLMRAIAICPHGQDMNAETQFSSKNQSVSLTYQEGTVPKENENAETEFTKEEFDALKTKLDELETKFAALPKEEGDSDAPKDLPTALAKIKEMQTQITELSKAKPEAGNTDTGGGTAEEEEESKFAQQVRELKDQVTALSKHLENSDGNTASGDDSDGTGKPTFASMFTYGGRKKETAT